VDSRLTFFSSSVFLGAILLLGTPFFFWWGPGYHSSRSFQSAWDLGHILFFLLLSLWLHNCLGKKKIADSPFLLFLAIFAFVFFLGFLLELLQMIGGNRTPDMGDVLRNQLGCLTAFAFFIRPSLFSDRSRRNGVRAGVLILLAMTVWPLCRSLFDEYLAARQFPILSDFETPFERDRWVNAQQLQEESERVRHGHKSVRVQLSTAKYSGIALFYFPHDWRGYQTLRCSVYNPQAAGLILNSRIHDDHHKEHNNEFSDRFNQPFTLEHGWNDLVIPLARVKNAPKGRTMDMEHIEGFGLFVTQQPQSLELYLDHVYLSE
jgi:hypothetical protein